MEKNKKTIHYEDALKHVNDVKTFYLNIFVYVIFVAIGLLFKANLLEFVLNNTDNLDPRFLHWLHINLILVPIVWWP